jgi:hypothetical protein
LIELKKLISISLSLLLLFSNTGFSINTHFCGGEAKETTISIGAQKTGCGMEEEAGMCDKSPRSEKKISASPCCKDHHQIVQLVDKANIKSFSVEINPTFLLSFLNTYAQPEIFAEQAFTKNPSYFPGIPDKDIQVLYQTFLI